MITKDNFKDVLKELGFQAEGNIFQKFIGEAELKVDFDQEKIIYPENKGLKVNRRDTCNFSQDENFVVFECVHRLIEKGYKPEHLELEPTWQVGRGASGGRADILVKDQENKPLLIIECKTPDDEFERAWRKTQQDGDQLFSYAQQIAEIQYLCLYTSNLIGNQIRVDQKIIAHRDDEKLLEHDTTLLSFTKATNVEDRFAAWSNTYQSEHAENGIFEDNIPAYQIGKNNYTLADDTKAIDAVDKEGKYHDFRTILRKHNIARRENAFEVLVNLFLCKLVDEEDNENDLKFYWKGMTYDTYFDFVDRLQDLYQKGMGKFLNEEISYISNEQIDAAFWTVRNKRNATKQQIQRYFRELKFFTNSAFSFIDTHNEKLFNKNAEVLSEVVQMWQRLRLKTDDQNQFLGEMFELFLDDGIKQSEGQFFTPLPICKFIVASLPLAQKIADSPEPIKAIDYACGSGHFLNEYAHQIKPLAEKQGRDLSAYYSQITGIEKEDRLAKVAKVAAYMHGQGQIKILDADALASHPEVAPEGFDVLVANPPFAVEGFLETLNDADKKQYQLIKATGAGSNTDNIECFFLERIHHLMAPGGIVGVIVPSSILSNADAVHTRTREILLQFFDIVSIAELRSGTFGKTGTNTVVLFLRRKSQKPEASEHYYNRVVDFFEGDHESAEYQDDYLIKVYCEHIEVPHEEYIKLFAQTSLEPLVELLQYDIFNDYKQAFSQSTEIKNLQKSNVFKKKTAEEQSAEFEQRFIACLHDIEKDKLYYFILAHEQAGKVLLVNAPNTNKEQKQFLGYWWSKAKGREGIKYDRGKTVNDIITPLFDPKNLDNDTKINTAIKRNFIGETTNPLPEYCQYAELTDMLDFSRTDFNKVISLNPKQNIDIETKWELVKLGDKVNSINGLWEGKRGPFSTVNVIRNTDFVGDGKIDFANVAVLEVETKQFQSRKLCSGDIIVEKSGGSSTQAVGRVVYFDMKEGEYSFSNFTSRLRIKDKNINPKYLIVFLNYFYEKGHTFNLQSGISGIRNLDFDRYLKIKIPLPPLEVQQQIVKECETVDQETERARQTIMTTKQRIEEQANRLWSESRKEKLDNVIWINTKTYDPTKKSDNEFIYIDIDSVGKANGVIDFSKRLTGKNAPSRARRIAKNGNTIISTVRPYLKGFALVDTDNINDCVFSTGFAILEPKSEEFLLNKMIFYSFMYMDGLMQQMKGTMEKSSYPSINEGDIKNYQIPVPSLDIQQRLVTEVEQLETEITQAQALIDTATERKNAILTKYL